MLDICLSPRNLSLDVEEEEGGSLPTEVFSEPANSLGTFRLHSTCG